MTIAGAITAADAPDAASFAATVRVFGQIVLTETGADSAGITSALDLYGQMAGGEAGSDAAALVGAVYSTVLGVVVNPTIQSRTPYRYLLSRPVGS